MYVGRPRLFLGIGLLLIPLGVVISIVQALVLGGFGLAGVDTTGESAGALVLLVTAIGTTLAVLGFGARPGRDGLRARRARCRASDRPDAGLPAGTREDTAAARRPRHRRAAWVLLDATVVLVPVAIWLAVSSMLLAQAVVLEDRSAVGGLRRSFELVRGRWFRVASLVGVGAVVTIAAGPLLGALLIFATDAPLALLNIVAGIVYALAMPFVALTTTYVYFDARVKVALAPRDEPVASCRDRARGAAALAPAAEHDATVVPAEAERVRDGDLDLLARASFGM